MINFLQSAHSESSHTLKAAVSNTTAMPTSYCRDNSEDKNGHILILKFAIGGLILMFLLRV